MLDSDDEMDEEMNEMLGLDGMHAGFDQTLGLDDVSIPVRLNVSFKL